MWLIGQVAAFDAAIADASDFQVVELDASVVAVADAVAGRVIESDVAVVSALLS